MRATRHQPARHAAHKIRNTCYNEIHMNVICLQYCSLPLCRWSGRGALGTSRTAGSCRGPGQVAVAGLQPCRHVHHPRPRPREVPLKVRYPGGVVVKAVLGDDVLLVRRGRPLCHVRLQLVDERRHRRHALTHPPSIDET
jgi:hypothetical protein